MTAKVKLLLHSTSLKDSAVMFLGGGIATFLGFILTIILTRNLDAASFGLFITSLTFIQAVTDFSEMGINSAVFNFVSSTKNKERISFIETTLIIKLGLALLISIIIFVFSDLIANFFLKDDDIIFFIKYSSIGVFLLILVTWGQTVLQAQRRFIAYSFNNLSMNLFRVVILLLLITLGIFNALNAFVALQLMLFVTLVFLLFSIKISYFKLSLNIEHLKKILRFGLPVGIGFSFWAIYTKLDQILILKLEGAEEAGIYGVAFRISMMIIFVASIFGTVITPRFASLGVRSFYTYFKKTLLGSFCLGLISTISIILAPTILPLIFGTNFANSILPFQILATGSTLFTFSIPFSYAILYYFKNPYFMMWSSALYLVLLWFLLNQLIPILGSVGAALSMLIMYAFQLILSIAFFIYLAKFKKAVNLYYAKKSNF